MPGFRRPSHKLCISKYYNCSTFYNRNDAYNGIQVTKRKQKGDAACVKLKECFCIMKQLEKWLKEVEEKYRKISAVAKSKERLEEQLYDVKVSTYIRRCKQNHCMVNLLMIIGIIQ